MSTLVFKKLGLRNFMAFGNNLTEVDLTYGLSTLIQGENLDRGGANGVGKTTIINALCYAIFNKPFDNISLQRLLNTTNSAKETQMEVMLEFEKGDDVYHIHRLRGTITNIKISKNDEDVTLDSVTGNDKFVEELIGMSYELFTRVIIFSGNSLPFLQLPVSTQRNVIEELFKTTRLTEKAVALKEVIRETENQLSILLALKTESEKRAAQHMKQVKEAEQRIERWDAERRQKIQNISETVEKYRDVDFASARDALEAITEFSTLKTNVERRESDVTKIVKSLAADQVKLKAEISHLEDANCPYCKQKFADAEAHLVEARDRLAVLDTQHAEHLLQLETLAIEKAEYVNALAELNQGLTFPNLNGLLTAQNLIQNAEQRLAEVTLAQNPHTEALLSLKCFEPELIDTDKIDETRRLLDHQQLLHKLLTDKNSFIRRTIINRTVPFLNERINFYTKDFGLPHLVKYSEDMSCTVSEFGRELDYGNLSSGEKKRVNLALSLAFRDVVHHLNTRYNLMFIDEIEGSLDQNGVDAMFRMMKTKARDEQMGLWIISHHPSAVDRFDRTLIIQKENGFSNII